jgi:hypothetical protein
MYKHGAQIERSVENTARRSIHFYSKKTRRAPNIERLSHTQDNAVEMRFLVLQVVNFEFGSAIG